MSDIERELIARGVINPDNICISCGERYAPDGLFCYRCKNGNFVVPKKELNFIYLQLEKSINKELIKNMPYLQPRNVWTDEIPKDYDYEYIRGEHELPEGWFSLFLDMCKDIRKPLEKSSYLNKFRFTQIKEKYGSLRVYNNGCPEEVHDIFLKYERISRFTCSKCGRLATRESQDYILPYCRHCAKIASKGKYLEKFNKIIFSPFIKISGYKNGKRYKRRLNCFKEFLSYHLNRNNKTPLEIIYKESKEESK